ncbi:D-alanyl-D-alanine carboxypeptidase [Klebsiella michiganensis]|uniref:D-alanyl-D-alanine carboxypeptidase n=1 Tax=Klebsiella michiganensis TaxID=1134687 RepID=A0A7H4PJD8_9ENTR|nr:D-alanyl-D-alanine carboxypeptidase [Klebsiella michiganensis]
MKGRFFIAVSLLAASVSCAFAANDFPVNVTPPSIQAGSWVLMDYTTGQILTAGNEHQQRNPASLTKTHDRLRGRSRYRQPPHHL